MLILFSPTLSICRQAKKKGGFTYRDQESSVYIEGRDKLAMFFQITF